MTRCLSLLNILQLKSHDISVVPISRGGLIFVQVVRTDFPGSFVDGRNHWQMNDSKRRWFPEIKMTSCLPKATLLGTNSSHMKIGHPKKTLNLPAIHFQVRTVREGKD